MSNKISTLNINRSESLSKIEELIRELHTSKEYKIRLPSKLNTRGALGIEVAIIQLIGTWLDKSDKKIFHSHQGKSPEEFCDLCTSIYGLAILSMADEIWDKQKTPLPRKDVLNNAKDTIENIRTMNFGATFKSRYFGIPCIKKPTYDREFLMPVYNGSKVIESGVFFKMLNKILENKISGESRFNTLDEFIGVEDLSDLLWELFNNSHDHGRMDAVGNELPHNFRSIIIQQQDVTQDYFKSWLGKQPTQAQQKFYSKLKWPTINQPILDISVIDFGTGFVDMAKEKAGLEDDMDVLIKCLESGWSRLRKKNRGVGLTKVLTKVSKHRGWLRIRTGNYLVEKAYTSEDEFTITKGDVTKMDCCVVGASIHISIPLNKKID